MIEAKALPKPQAHYFKLVDKSYKIRTCRYFIKRWMQSSPLSIPPYILQWFQMSVMHDF